jgi:hypothetical protein
LPSKLGNNISVLTCLKDAVVSGTCQFRTLSTTEKRKHQEDCDRRLASEELVPPVQKTRKDASKKHSHSVVSNNEDDLNNTLQSSADASAASSVAARAGLHTALATVQCINSDNKHDNQSEDVEHYQPFMCSCSHSPQNDQNDELNTSLHSSDSLDPALSLPSQTPPVLTSSMFKSTSASAIPPGGRFTLHHGEILCNSNGRCVHSATPPVGLATQKRVRVPTKVVHLGYQGAQRNKENVAN